MYCFLLQIFMFQLSSASTPKLHTNPAIPSNASLDPLETSIAHGATPYIFYALHVNNGHRRAPQHVGKWAKKGVGQNYFTFYDNK